MARLLVLLLLAPACAAGPFPPPVIPAQPSVADWPDTGAVVLEDEATLEYVLDPLDAHVVRAVIDHRRRIKILSAEGLSAADVELWTDEMARVGGIVGRSVRPDGSIVELDALSRAPVPEAPKLLDVGHIRFRVPGAQVGGLIEYRYQRTFPDAYLVPAWIFGGRYPVLRAELSILFPKALRLDYRFGKGPRVEEVLPLRRPLEDGRERLVFVQKDLPVYYAERFAPHPSRVQPWVASVITSNSSFGTTLRLESWNDVLTRLLGYFGQVGGTPGSGPTPARFRAVRNSLSIVDALGLGVRRPVAVSRLLAHEPGSSRDAVAVLLNALRGSNVEAYPALISSAAGEVAVEGFPSLSPFARPVVAVRAKGDAADRTGCGLSATDTNPACRTPPDDFLFLDASCSYCRYGELPWELAGGRAVVLMPNGARWLELPLDPPEQHRASVQLRLSFDAVGAVSGKVDGQLTGNVARGARALANQPAGEARDRGMSALALGAGEAALVDVELTSVVNVDQPVAFTSLVRTKLQKLGYEQFELRPEAIVGSSFGDAFRAVRRTPAVLEAPRSTEHIVLLEMPVGYEVELPPQVRISRPYAEYSAGYERRERILTYVRRLRLLAHVIELDAWDDFHAFVTQVAEIEATPVRIYVPN